MIICIILLLKILIYIFIKNFVLGSLVKSKKDLQVCIFVSIDHIISFYLQIVFLRLNIR